MNCSLDRTTAFGDASESVASGVPARRKPAGRVGIVGEATYRLTPTAPTA